MLGEKHAFTIDFPELTAKAKQICSENAHFLKEMNRYNELDNQIRNLEQQSTPISDDEMNKLKHQRSTLKDELYQQITAA